MEDVRIGIDVGGTNFRLGVVRDLRVVWEKRFQADFAGLCRKSTPHVALDSILSILQAAITEARVAFPAVLSVGIGFPGFIDPHSRHVLSSPNLPNLLDADLVSPLRSRCGLPVALENDASAAAYGEYALSDQTDGDLIYIGLGTGVGGGLVLGGRLHGGMNGVAMEIGHMIVEADGRLCGCGNHGCLEQYASTGGVVKSYASLTGKTLTALEIAKLAEQRDSAAVRCYEQAGEYLAAILADVVKIVDVSQVVIGGGMSASWPLMRGAFEKRLEHDLIPVLRGKLRVHISRAQDQAGIIGAAMLARDAARA